MRNLGLLPESKEEEFHCLTPDELNAHSAGVSVSHHGKIGEAMDEINKASEEGFEFKPTNFYEVVLAIKNSSSQARGANGVPRDVVAKALPALGDLVVHILNFSLAYGIFPETRKRAQLIALKKIAAPSGVLDFRPIAMLCFLSKVLEKIAHDQTTEFFKGSNLLDRFQTGFQQHHSIQTMLLKLTDDIRGGVDGEKITLLLFFDSSDAFDTISLSKLLSKLRELSFSELALLWI